MNNISLDHKEWNEISQSDLEMFLYDNYLIAKNNFSDNGNNNSFDYMAQCRKQYLSYLEDRDDPNVLGIGSCYETNGIYFWDVITK